VSAAEVRTMLGSIDQDAMDRVLRALVDADARALLAVVSDVAEHGTGTEGLLDELLLALHRIALAQLDPALVDDERLRALAARFTPEDVQLYYQIGLLGRRDLAFAPDLRTGVEMTLLRMLAFRPAASPAGAAPAPPAPAGASRATASAGHAVPAPALASGATPAPASPPPPTAENWGEVVAGLKLAGLLRELASHTLLESAAEGTLSLVLSESCAGLYNKEREAEFKRVLEGHYGRALKLRLRIGQPPGETPAQGKTRERNERQEAAERAIQSDPAVGQLVEKLNARVIPGTIRPKT
jgi:DNA polymerase-3 subunit gamma/tau